MHGRTNLIISPVAAAALTLSVLPAAAMARSVARSDRRAPTHTARSLRLPPRPNILDGTSALGTSLSMVARVLYLDGSGSFLCSGTVVSPDVVLTAGHCAEDLQTGATDVAADYQVTTSTQTDSSGGQVSGVAQVIPDPQFDPTTLTGDAALLVLSTPTTAPPVALASDPADAGLYGGGTATIITGWGVDDSAGDLPSELMYGYSTIQSTDYCATEAAELEADFDPGSELCAIDAPGDADGTCHGDSGGPILATVDDAWVELGITSFGAANCDTDHPGYFTRVDAIAPWIESEIAQYAAAPSPSPGASGSSTASPPPTTTVSVTPADTATAAAGTYRGHTSQGLAITLRVGRSGTTVGATRFGFVMHCPHRAATAYTITPNLRWDLTRDGGLGFGATLTDRGGFAYRLGGVFTSGGSAQGTLSVTAHGSRGSICHSGRVRWHAAA